MENLLLFAIYKIKDDKLIKTYKIYINGDIDGFDEADGIRYGISNYFPHFCRKAGISMAAFFPNISIRDD